MKLPKEFAPILKKCKAELEQYQVSQHTLVLMDILILVDPCISKFTLKIEIINNHMVIHHAPPTSSGLFKRRSDGIIILLQQTLQKHVIEDCVLFLHVKDSYINYDEPFFIYARPDNRKGLLYIDHSWIDAEPEKKITKEKGGEMISITDIAERAYRPTGPRNKKNSLFFIGQNVPLINSNDFFFRKHFAKLQWPFEVKTTGYLNMSEYSKWKYLLNLPGWYPWSFRFKFLFLMNSFVININLLRPNLNEGKWCQIIDALFVPGKDYIDIDYVLENDIIQLEKAIVEIFKRYNYEKQEFDKIVENGRKKGALLTSDNILTLNATVFNGYANYYQKYNKPTFDYSLLDKKTEQSDKIIFDYKSKLTISAADLLYSNNSKVFQLTDKYVLKCYPCSLLGYSELKTYEKLNNMHKCFSKIYDSFIDTNTLYLLLDSFDLNLNDYKNSHKITKVQWKKIKAELITAITALHSLQLCHNNICPENIMYSYKQDRFYFIDFKMAKQSTEEDKLRDLKQISILDKNVL